MDREIILKRVLAKLTAAKMTAEETEEIIFEHFIDRTKSVNQNYSKKSKLTDEKHDLLRKLYKDGEVKQLYAYGYQKFGFEAFGFRFDVDAAFIEIKKIK